MTSGQKRNGMASKTTTNHQSSTSFGNKKASVSNQTSSTKNKAKYNKVPAPVITLNWSGAQNGGGTFTIIPKTPER